MRLFNNISLNSCGIFFWSMGNIMFGWDTGVCKVPRCAGPYKHIESSKCASTHITA